MKEEKLTRLWFVIYLLSAGVVLAALLAIGVHWGPEFKEWLMLNFLPRDWHPVVDDLIGRLFAQQFRNFIVAAGIGIGLVAIGLTLFPLKEKLSSTYEHEAFPDLARPREPSLFIQGMEELKFAGLYLLLIGLGFYLTMHGLKIPALVLTHGYLIIAMTLDHCAPFFQRRGRSLHGIIFILLRKAPLRSFALGAAFIGPVIVLEKLLPPTLPPLAAISLMVLVEVIGMAFATLAGCRLGATLVSKNPELAHRPPPRSWTIGYRVVVATLALWLAVFFGWWAKGALTHQRLLKCRYHPLFKETTFKIRETTVLVELPIKVTNRSDGRIDPTGLLVEIAGAGVLDGTVTLEGPAVNGGESGEFPLKFTIRLDPESLIDLPKILKSDYSATLILDPPLSPPMRLKIFPR